MHLAGGVAIACFFARALEALAHERAWLRMDPRALALFAIGWTGTATVVWELAEFLCDRYAGTSAQGGLEDTLGDMLVGLVGGFVYALARAVRARA